MKKNWFKIKEQWLTYFKCQVFDLEETRNNTLESTFNKVFYLVFVLVFVCLFAISEIFKSLLPSTKDPPLFGTWVYWLVEIKSTWKAFRTSTLFTKNTSRLVFRKCWIGKSSVLYVYMYSLICCLCYKPSIVKNIPLLIHTNYNIQNIKICYSFSFSELC